MATYNATNARQDILTQFKVAKAFISMLSTAGAEAFEVEDARDALKCLVANALANNEILEGWVEQEEVVSLRMELQRKEKTGNRKYDESEFEK